MLTAQSNDEALDAAWTGVALGILQDALKARAGDDPVVASTKASLLATYMRVYEARAALVEEQTVWLRESGFHKMALLSELRSKELKDRAMQLNAGVRQLAGI